MEPPGAPPRLVCRCTGLSSTRIAEVVRRDGLRRIEELQRALGAGGVCGTCHPELREMLAELSGEPVPKALRLENERTCRAETARKLEGALQSGVLPRLPPGHGAEIVAVSGLEVRVRLEGPEAAALADGVRARLRKLVCAELEIVFV